MVLIGLAMLLYFFSSNLKLKTVTVVFNMLTNVLKKKANESIKENYTRLCFSVEFYLFYYRTMKKIVENRWYVSRN